MTCCQCQGIEQQFNEVTAARDLRRYRKKGPKRTTKMLIDALKKEGVDGLTLLDIGGGVGEIQHEMLTAGVQRATSVDASTAYLNAACKEATARGHADSMQFVHGDFVERAHQVEPADLVTLDRVICCYHDMQALVGLSAARAAKHYGVVYPRKTWWTRASFRVINFINRVTKNPFRAFIHEPDAVEALINKAGLHRQFYDTTFLWQVVVYTR